MKQRRGMEMVLAGQRPAIVALICLLACGLSVAAAVSASAAPIAAQDTSWQWGDSTPQGDALSDVRFIGSRGYAVGEEGTVLRSDDGGGSWTGEQSGTLENLSHVQEIDPNTLVVAGECTLRESTDAGASFQALLAGHDCPNAVSSFWFFNATTGFLQRDDGTLQFTTDAGQTLEAKTPLPLPGEKLPNAPSELHFVSPTVGFGLANGTQGGRIMRTTDGASSWTQVASSPQPLTDLTFVSATEAYAVGWHDTLLQSTDEGKTWHAQPLAVPPGTPPDFYGITCSDASNCVIATGASVVHTSDGGSTGSLISAASMALSAVAFSTGANAVAVGAGGETALSNDGGASFAMRVSHHLEPLELSSTIRIGASSLDAYIPGRKGIAATHDGGMSWSELRPPTSDPIVDVAFPAGEVGYAVDESGTVFRTATAGRTWSIASADDRAPVALLAPSADTVLLIGSAGVRRSTDGGASFGALRAVDRRKRRHRGRRGAARARLYGAQAAGGAVFAIGEDVYRSTDEGVRWTLIPRPLARQPVEDASFVSAGAGYELCDGLLFFTRDSGRHWRQIDSVPTDDTGEGAEIAFSSASDGYVLSEYPEEEKGLFPFRTQDGGRTWIPEAIPGAHGIAATGTVDYVDGRGLYWTTTGGLLASRSQLTLAIAGPHRTTTRRLEKTGHTVHVSGHLQPATGGEQVMISWLQRGSWDSEPVTVSASGQFALTVAGISQTTNFIAQWEGNGVVSGAGTPALRLTVVRARRAHGRHR